MSKHTPGPWTAAIDETNTVRDARNNQLAIFTFLHTRTGGRRDAAEVSANCRLAAAAPELLAALQGAEKALAKALPHLPADTVAIYCGEWLAEIRETLAQLEVTP